MLLPLLPSLNGQPADLMPGGAAAGAAMPADGVHGGAHSRPASDHPSAFGRLLTLGDDPAEGPADLFNDPAADSVAPAGLAAGPVPPHAHKLALTPGADPHQPVRVALESAGQEGSASTENGGLVATGAPAGSGASVMPAAPAAAAILSLSASRAPRTDMPRVGWPANGGTGPTGESAAAGQGQPGGGKPGESDLAGGPVPPGEPAADGGRATKANPGTQRGLFAPTADGDQEPVPPRLTDTVTTGNKAAPAPGQSGSRPAPIPAAGTATLIPLAAAAGDEFSLAVSAGPESQPGGATPLTVRVIDAARATPQQIASSVAMAISRQHQAGVNRFEIRLNPPEMGRIDVKMELDGDGQVRTHLIVDRSETLDMFQREQRVLERTLQQMGLKVEDGALQFSLRQQGDGRAASGSNDGGANGMGEPSDDDGETADDQNGSSPAYRPVYASGVLDFSA